MPRTLGGMLIYSWDHMVTWMPLHFWNGPRRDQEPRTGLCCTKLFKTDRNSTDREHLVLHIGNGGKSLPFKESDQFSLSVFFLLDSVVLCDFYFQMVSKSTPSIMLFHALV